MINHTSTCRADKRRQALVLAAYHSIAQYGLLGLRTREVAAQAGITHATLHHYFSTKEALIQAVVDYAIYQRLAASMSTEYDGISPADRLHGLLVAVYQQIQEEPTLFVVLNEFSLHAHHDPAIRDMIQEKYRCWHESLVSLLEEGIRQGSFRTDLNPTHAASLLMTLILGLSLQAPFPSSTPEDTFGQLERWLRR